MILRIHPPEGVADGWMGVGLGMDVLGDVPYMHMHVKHAKQAKHGCLHVGGHLQFLYMY